MRYFLGYFLGAILLFWGSVYGAFAVSFLPGFGDIPQADGIVLRLDSAVSFETVDGRIAEISGDYSVSRDRIAKFYRRTLPVLGWRLLSDDDIAGEASLRLLFVRGGEALTLDFFNGARSYMRFQLSPE